jgi:hypothetical protein
MAAHPYIQPYTLDLSDDEQKSSDVLRLFEKAAENTPALVILEDLDRAFPRREAHTGKSGELPDIAELPRRSGIAGRRAWLPRPTTPPASTPQS